MYDLQEMSPRSIYNLMKYLEGRKVARGLTDYEQSTLDDCKVILDDPSKRITWKGTYMHYKEYEKKLSEYHQHKDNLIKLVNDALDIELYDYQVDYILNITPTCQNSEGCTIVHIIKMLLVIDDNDAPLKLSDSDKWLDRNDSSIRYKDWFIEEVLNTHRKLKSAGVPVREIIK